VLGELVSDALPGIATAIIDRPPHDTRQEARFIRADGESVYLGFSTSNLLNADAEKVGRIVIFQDLSEIKEMEEQMRRSERLAAVGKLSAAIAHEIRNPLASISGSVEMLRAGAEMDEDDRVLMSIVLREVDRLNELISEFLEYSRPRKLHLSPQSLTPMIQSVLDLFHNRTSNRVDVNFEARPNLPEVELDSEVFQQVIWNLLNNAAEATESVDAPKVDVRLHSDDDDVVLEIEDNGPGIDDENVDRVFQPFFTTKKTGTGLGLATIYRIVEEHAGTIAVEPHGGMGGACFRLVLPAIRSEPGVSNDVL
jgi:two-component system sensor histidine kinase PilS (NtrC family)